jgi:hypothetical protein
LTNASTASGGYNEQIADNISDTSSADAKKLREMGTVDNSDPSGLMEKGVVAASLVNDGDDDEVIIFDAASTSPSFR